MARLAAGAVNAPAPAARFVDPTLTPTLPFLVGTPTATPADLQRAIVNSYPNMSDFDDCHGKTEFLNRQRERVQGDGGQRDAVNPLYYYRPFPSPLFRYYLTPT